MSFGFTGDYLEYFLFLISLIIHGATEEEKGEFRGTATNHLLSLPASSTSWLIFCYKTEYTNFLFPLP